MASKVAQAIAENQHREALQMNQADIIARLERIEALLSKLVKVDEKPVKQESPKDAKG